VWALLTLLLLLASSALAQQFYTVVAGDTLYGIARRHSISVTSLKQLNGLADSTLRVGQVLALSLALSEANGVATAPSADAVPGFITHTVATGETLAGLVAHFQVSREALLEINAAVAVGGSFPAGVRLRIPTGPVHRLAEGENLLTVALRFGLSPAELAAANGLSGSSLVAAGQWLVIPAARSELLAAKQLPQDRRSVLLAQQRQLAGRASQLLTRYQPPAEGFRWPLATRGVITSPFGPRSLAILGSTFHAGLDIAAPIGTPILASRHGMVTRSGWGGVYGYVVHLDHGDGSQTRYAHMSRILVAAGRHLMAGETLGLVGSTGVSTGPHLHFEIRLQGRAVNPLDFLTRP